MKTQLLKTAILILIASNFVVAQQSTIQNFRPLSLQGVSMFESPKDTETEFDVIKVRLGGAFSQQFQMLNHENSGDVALDGIRSGFNNATANLNIDVQLADGIRMELVTYLSSLHHTEAWVKGGYIQFDKLPFAGTDKIMENVTLKVGHMEVNYGDGHFRRTDNGNALYNPFVGNYIMDAFDTQIGLEAYFRTNGLIFMAGVTEGEIKGNTLSVVEERADGYAPAVYGKVGYDSQINEDFRLRITASYYGTEDLNNTNHLYDGDRTGSRYYNVIEAGNFRAGRFVPGFKNKVSGIMINPYIKAGGFEFFGMYEIAQGNSGSYDASNVWTYATEDRKVNQLAAEAVYRLGTNQNFYFGARYGLVSGQLFDVAIDDAKISRVQIAAGWFLTDNIQAKLEYVTQKYENYPSGNIYNGAKFDGLMLEAVVGF